MAFSDLMAAADITIRNVFAEATLTVTHKSGPPYPDVVRGIVLDPPILEGQLPVSTIGTTQLWIWVVLSDFPHAPPQIGDTAAVVGTYNGVDVSGSYVIGREPAIDSVGGCELFMRKQA